MADPSPRLIALDALRGAAVMGILLMNVTAFAMPTAAYLNPLAYGDPGGVDVAAWGLCFVLVDGKMRALFSFLFGASMLLVIDRAEAAGEDGATVHFRRMAVLLLIGFAHGYLIWSGDILVLYAGAGAIAFAFAARGTRWLVGMGLALLVAQMMLLSLFLGELTTLRDAALAPGAAADVVRAWHDVVDDIGVPSPAAIARDLAVHRGSYAGIVQDRLGEGFAPFLQYLDAGFETVGLMLLGMAGLRSGFLTGSWPRAAYARIAAGCYLVGLPALTLIALDCARGGFETVATVRASELTAAPFRPIVMIGHAALLLWWLGGSRGGAAKSRLAAVGRAALSNYIGTSIAMTTLFYGSGGGLYGHFRRAELYLVVPIAWLIMLLWSKPWLDRYRHGPVEWLWRSLARGHVQPFRRRKDIAS